MGGAPYLKECVKGERRFIKPKGKRKNSRRSPRQSSERERNSYKQKRGQKKSCQVVDYQQTMVSVGGVGMENAKNHRRRDSARSLI